MVQRISDRFIGIAVKRAAAVDVDPAVSNQHEITATKAVRAFLGETSVLRRFRARLVHVDEDLEPVYEDAEVTYYNAREGKPRAAEYRFYYPDNDVTRRASPGDLLVIALTSDQTLLVAFVAANTTVESQVRWLFGIDELPLGGFVPVNAGSYSTEITRETAEILGAAFGIEPELDDPDLLELILTRFPAIARTLQFPPTSDFSALARELVPDVDPVACADATLLAWLNLEYTLFVTLEKHLVQQQIDAGIDTVERLLEISLSVQNRRKARAGRSFELHLAEVFGRNGLRFSSTARTEHGARPDFLFPGQAAYDDPQFDPGRLRMAGAKTTAKDRWRQVLQEADRIQRKHLITAQAAISVQQTTEMEQLNVQLVVPSPIHASFTERQRLQLWTVADFIDDVRSTQAE